MTLTLIAGWLMTMTKYYDMLLNVGLLVLVLSLVSTFAVQLTGTMTDNIKVHSWNVKLLKALSVLPYWGTNPLQKKLFEMLKEMDEKAQAQEAQLSLETEEEPKA